MFKSAVAATVPPERLGSFFATTYLVLNTVSLAAQLFAVSWLMRHLSVNRVLSVLPAMVIAATSAVMLGGGLVAALALKGFDGVLRHSLHRTALEVLYVPLTGDLRSKVKGFIDVIGQRRILRFLRGTLETYRMWFCAHPGLKQSQSGASIVAKE